MDGQVMAINDLIAQGGQPIGRDLPQIANMLYQRQQQQQQNALAATQEKRAQDLYDLQKQKYSTDLASAQDQEITKNFSTVLDHLESVKGTDKYAQVLSAVQSSPRFAEGQKWMSDRGISMGDLADPAMLPAVRAKAGIALEKPEYVFGKPGEQAFRKDSNGFTPVGAPVPEKPDLTSDQKNYQAYSADETSNGRKPLSFNEWMLQGKRAGATNVSVNTDKTLYSNIAEKRAAEIVALHDQAQNAPKVIEQAAQVRDLLNKGAYTGTGADFKLQFGKGLRAIGVNSSEDDVSNTELLVSNLGQNTLDAIKASGLGSGQGFTDRDLKFLQGVTGGTIALDKNTLMRLSILHDRAARATILKWNTLSKKLNQSQLRTLGMDQVDTPSVTGSDPTQPVRVNTPEEAAKLAPGTIFMTPDGRVKTVPGVPEK